MLNDPLRKDVDRIGEDVALGFHKKKSFKITERNYRKPWREVDIIGEKANSVRFIEVKTVSREKASNGLGQVSDYKIRRATSSRGT